MNSFREITEAAGFGTDLVPSIRGEDPVFRTRYRVGEAGAAALAALGAAIAELRPQSVAVNLRAAAASLRSARYLRVDGKEPPVWDPMSGFYRVKDGWVSIHCNFPNHRQAALRVLDVPEERVAAEAKAVAWQGEALEEAIHAAGGCAGFVRSDAQWAAHPQSRAVAVQPLVRIARNGEAPREPLAKQPRPASAPGR